MIATFVATMFAGAAFAQAYNSPVTVIMPAFAPNAGVGGKGKTEKAGAQVTEKGTHAKADEKSAVVMVDAKGHKVRAKAQHEDHKEVAGAQKGLHHEKSEAASKSFKLIVH